MATGRERGVAVRGGGPQAVCGGLGIKHTDICKGGGVRSGWHPEGGKQRAGTPGGKQCRRWLHAW